MSRFALIGRILLLASAMVLAAVMSAWVIFAFLTRGGEIPVPDLSGRDLATALELTSRSNLGLRIEGNGYDVNVPPGQVLSQDPRPVVRIRKSRIVRVVVSQGTPTVYVPNLSGLSLRRVELQLSSAGLALGRVSRVHHEDVEAGAVVAQSPSPETFVARGREVSVLLSEGVRPRRYLLPDLTGFPADDVMATLRTWGLTVGQVTETQSADLPPGTVVGLQPEPGSEVTEGQIIHVRVSVMPGGYQTSPVILYRYSAPLGLLDRHLQVTLSIGEQENIVYEDTVPAGSTVTVPVPVSGAGIMKIYVDGVLVEEKGVP